MYISAKRIQVHVSAVSQGLTIKKSYVWGHDFGYVKEKSDTSLVWVNKSFGYRQIYQQLIHKSIICLQVAHS